MNVKMSIFLQEKKSLVKKLVSLLKKQFDYVSVLGTDVTGMHMRVTDKTTDLANTQWVERGFVTRVYQAGRYYEYAFNQLSAEALPGLVQAIASDFSMMAKITSDIITYPLITEKETENFFAGEVEIPLDELTAKEKLEKLRALNKAAHEYSKDLADFTVVYSATQVSKLFVSDKKDLEQSYIWSEAYLVPMVRRNGITRTLHKSYSGLKGLEILDEMESGVGAVIRDACKLLEAEQIVPGEYDVICAPAAVGIIAHEAFGHGVEMDMFVKNRAKGAEYINKPVASALVNMRDGAASTKHVSSYLFDDEGTLGSDTVIIQNGILKTGISDLLSALKLGTVPTGNGKRQSFEHKAYTRMTNTFFEPGEHTLEEMIASISHGYFIELGESGMEDPKDWGIQCMFSSAVEIVDGKLTGRLVAPVIMTGYVPELLRNITMLSKDFVMSGSGMCGKGHKEWVKVSDGGPYIKTKARLG